MNHPLFVYGTLRPGRENAYLLERIGGSWEAATVTGRLYPQGCAQTEGYPVLILEGDDPIKGFVFHSEHMQRHWPQLDQFEGDGYRRVLTEVRLEDNSPLTAYVYVLKNG